jgi:hypothetical protein
MEACQECVEIIEQMQGCGVVQDVRIDIGKFPPSILQVNPFGLRFQLESHQ